jgi:hypothetical protein
MVDKPRNRGNSAWPFAACSHRAGEVRLMLLQDVPCE